MISRQSFFKRLAVVVTAVALAPEIAFATRLPIAVPPPELDLVALMDQFYALNLKRWPTSDEVIIYTDAEGVKACERWLAQCQPQISA